MENNFWLNDPKVLFSIDIIPKSKMTTIERLNSITRLLIVITGVMYLLDYKNYMTILILGIFFIIILNCNEQDRIQTQLQTLPQEQILPQEHFNGSSNIPLSEKPEPQCWYASDTDLINATYEITPKIQFNHDDSAKRSYMNAKYELTPLVDTDGFKEIWRSEPGMCGGYTMVPDLEEQEEIEPPMNQCNYIVRSKIDHLNIPQESNDLVSMRPIAEEAFNKATMDFRQGIMNDHIDRFRRERQHNCADMKLSTAGAGAGGNI